MTFQCDTAARTPIYQQLMDQVRAAVAQGRLAPGERLPSIRQLSRELVVNPNTIARAYSELEREGVLFLRQGAGAYVAERQPDVADVDRRRRLEEALDRFLTEAVHLGLTEHEVRDALVARLEQFRFADTPHGTDTPQRAGT